MMAVFRAASMILLCFACAAPCSTLAQSPAQQLQKVLETSKRSIVKIRVVGRDPSGKEEVREGTGFFFFSNKRRSYIATAYHLIGSSEAIQKNNSDWRVENGLVDRNIEIFAFDDSGNLVRRAEKIHVTSFQQSGVDLSVLLIDQGNFKVLPIGDVFESDEAANDVVLLAFQNGAQQLTRPYKIGIGQPSGLKYATDKSSSKGESGGPWIDLRNGNAIAAVSGRKTTSNDVDNEATLLVPLKTWINTYERQNQTKLRSIQIPDAPPVQPPLAEVESETKPARSDGPPEFAQLNTIYFRRPVEGDIIANVMQSMKINWRTQRGDTSDPSNVVTCGSDQGLAAAKMLALELLRAGVPLRGIAPQASPISNKVTVEFYPQYIREPVITESVLSNVQKCPTWKDVLSAEISVKNECSYRWINVYLRYYDTASQSWITKAKYGLGPSESWAVKDSEGRTVGSGKPFVRAIVTTRDSNWMTEGTPVNRTVGSSSGPASHFLNSIPDQSFRMIHPRFRYTCDE